MRACVYIFSLWAVNAYCQFTTVGLGTSMGIMGVLQGIGSSAISIGNNAINNLNSAINQRPAINPNTGLPLGALSSGGGGMQINPTTGLPAGGSGGGQAGVAPPQSLGPARPIVSPTVMPLPSGSLGPMVSTGKGRKFGPVMRMVSMSGFRVLRSPRRTSRSTVKNSAATLGRGQSSVFKNAYGDVGGRIRANPARPQTSRVSVSSRAVSSSGGRALRVSLRLKNQLR